jgi:hypothetical protein
VYPPLLAARRSCKAIRKFGDPGQPGKRQNPDMDGVYKDGPGLPGYLMQLLFRFVFLKLKLEGD